MSKKTPHTPRMTQRRIAELAQVSQTTVSLVMNGKADDAHIPAETVQRVLDIVASAQYVADPAARRLAGVGNRILGIFTYESAFPTETVDFYTPLLTGIEAAAEQAGHDLLMFTSAPVENGRRHLFHPNNRLRLADGCLLLGREMDADELTRLVQLEFPFVAIGRRETSIPVPYVGVDYVNATAALVADALKAGHRDLYYLHLDSDGESVLDRQAGYFRELMGSDARFDARPVDTAGLRAAWEEAKVWRPTVLFVEDPVHAEQIHDWAASDGLRVPEDLSMVVLGEHVRPDDRVDFTRLAPPRVDLGSRAVQALNRMLADDEAGIVQELLHCPVQTGCTLAAPTQGVRA
jgi:DNA-binding LacI/PurR family transcriptional regulator